MTLTFAIVGAIVVLFVWDRLPVVVVAMATALALWATGVLDLGQALAGFGDPAVLFIASLFVVSAGLEATGATAWIGQVLIDRAGESRARLLVLTMLLVSVLTALINLNGAVAALLPVVVVMAVRLGRPPSQLLMPLVFSGHAGSLLALTGTPVNVLVSDAAVDAGQAPFGYFEFAWVGLPLLLGTIGIILLLGPRLLPNRSGKSIPEIVRPAATTRLGIGDVLLVDLFVPDTDAEALAHDLGLELLPLTGAYFIDRAQEVGMVEVMLPEGSSVVGRTLVRSEFRTRYDVTVVGLRRGNQTRSDNFTSEELRVGDILLVAGFWTDIRKLQTHRRDLVVLDRPAEFDEVLPAAARAPQALACLLLVVGLMVSGVVPNVQAALIGCLLMGALRCVDFTSAYLSIPPRPRLR